MSIASALHPKTFSRTLGRHPRLLTAIGVGVALLLATTEATQWRTSTRALIAWNGGILVYLVLAWTTMFRSDEAHMRARSRFHDEGEVVILAASIGAAALSLVAIVAELATTKDAVGWLKGAHVTLGVLTLLTSWAFVHTTFAFHYAHEYYAARIRCHEPCIDFPKTENPVYSDFLYFSFVIGTSGQTADVSFLTTRSRRIGLLHCVMAFVFNTTVLALMINIAAGLI